MELMCCAVDMNSKFSCRYCLRNILRASRSFFFVRNLNPLIPSRSLTGHAILDLILKLLPAFETYGIQFRGLLFSWCPFYRGTFRRRPFRRRSFRRRPFRRRSFCRRSFGLKLLAMCVWLHCRVEPTIEMDDSFQDLMELLTQRAAVAS